MLWLRLGILLYTGGALLAEESLYGIGRPASKAEVAAWDIAIGPQGKELPPGHGVAAEGALIYARKCARCHGQAGRGGEFDVLVGGVGTLSTRQPVKTIGSFWPYATTVWDYINRAEPQGEIGTLTANEVYALTAYLLALNKIISGTETMNARTLPKVRMPNRDGFVRDVRPDWGDRRGQANKK